MRRRAVRRYTGRRRRAKYTWLPLIGEVGGQDPSLPDRINDDVGFDIALNVTAEPTLAETSIGLTVLTFDSPVETSSLFGAGGIPGGTPMGYFMQNEYLLKRIVGNLFVTIDSRLVNDEKPSAALVAAGFFVARADDTRVNNDQPVGAQEGLPGDARGAIFNYSPLSPTTAREPWIWRRSWILSPFGAGTLNGAVPITPTGSSSIASLVDGGGAYFPPTNVHYGTDKTNHYVDAKTARRVRQDERLFFVIAARAWALHQGITGSGDLLLKAHMDVRLLGAPRKARNRGAF